MGLQTRGSIITLFFILCAEILEKVIRNNNNIHGITIYNKGYKISQYADDTILFVNGSKNSLREKLDVLQTFYEMSGLKIKIDETKSDLDRFTQ